jgi:hypothetical protein
MQNILSVRRNGKMLGNISPSDALKFVDRNTFVVAFPEHVRNPRRDALQR